MARYEEQIKVTIRYRWMTSGTYIAALFHMNRSVEWYYHRVD